MKNLPYANWWPPRFSLKALLIVFTLAAVLAGSLGVHFQRVRRQRLAVANLALTAPGTGVRYEAKYMYRHGLNGGLWTPTTLSERWQEWVATNFGKDAAYQVHHVSFHLLPSAEALKNIPKLPWLRTLSVGVGTGLNDEAWQVLLECNQIEKLTLVRDTFNAPRLAGLSKLSQLQHLVIGGGELTIDDTQEITRLKQLTHLELNLVGTTDEALQPLSKLASLELFHLMHRGLAEQVTDQGVEFVAKLPALRSLTLARLPLVTDRVFAHIESLTHLESLNLDQASILGTEIHRLKKLPNLKHLNLIGTQVDDTTLQQIALFTQLESLNLYGTQVTDAGMHHLTGLHRIRNLSLGGTGSEISDAGLKQISSLSQLEELGLHRTKVTYAGIQYLLGLQKLRSLALGETGISHKGKALIKQQFPSCSIH